MNSNKIKNKQLWANKAFERERVQYKYIEKENEILKMIKEEKKGKNEMMELYWICAYIIYVLI